MRVALPGRVAGQLVVPLAALVDILLWGGSRALVGGGTLPVFVVPTVTAITYAVLLFRWGRPVGVFAIILAYSAAAFVLPDYAPIAGLLVALHAVASRSRLRVAGLALAACFVPFGVDCYRGAQNRVHVDTSFLASFAAQFSLYAVLTTTVWGLGRLAYAAQLRSETLQSERAAAAVTAERRRVARELHDIVGDAVTAMHLTAAGAGTLVGRDDARVRESLNIIATTGVQAMNELHRMLNLLRSVDDPDSVLPSPTAPVLSSDLSGVLIVARAAGLDVVTAVDGEASALDRSVDRAAFCVVQEALTNSVKHAGRGASARVELIWADTYVQVVVRDWSGVKDANADAPMSSGFGLLGLAERVTLAGGTLTAGECDGGFLVQARFSKRHEAPVPSSPR